MNHTKLTGKTALVTGAAGAIGSAICRTFANDGLKLILVDLQEQSLRELADELPVESHCLALDIADHDAVVQGCHGAFESLAPADVLVNCAGILSNNKLAETTTDEWRRVLAVNLDGAFFLTQQVVPHMKAQRWGRIVNLASWAWKSGGRTAGTAYTVSKGGIVSLTFSAARELAEYGITVNGIAPCYVMSYMVSEQLTEKQRNQLRAEIPLNRFCEPEEVAHSVRFFVSPLASFITGEILDMNGGLQFD